MYNVHFLPDGTIAWNGIRVSLDTESLRFEPVEYGGLKLIDYLKAQAVETNHQPK